VINVSDGSLGFLFLIISFVTSSARSFNTFSLAVTIVLSVNSSKIHKAV